MNRLYALIPNPPAAEDDYDREKAAEAHWGVEVVSSGNIQDDHTGEVLIAIGSDKTTDGHSRTVEWSETMTLDLDELAAAPTANGWDAKLTAAIAALGITPVRETRGGDGDKEPVGPQWLVFPSYG